MFYTNSNSRKGRELEQHAHAAMVMHWAPLERQVRVEGRVEVLSTAESDEYFHSCVLPSCAQEHNLATCCFAASQLRLRCCAGQISPLCSWRRRPRGSQIGAWVSQQSSVLSSREELDKAAQKLEDRYRDGHEVPRPPHWNGYKLIPSMVEFWQVHHAFGCFINL